MLKRFPNRTAGKKNNNGLFITITLWLHVNIHVWCKVMFMFGTYSSCVTLATLYVFSVLRRSREYFVVLSLRWFVLPSLMTQNSQYQILWYNTLKPYIHVRANISYLWRTFVSCIFWNKSMFEINYSICKNLLKNY